MMALLGVIGGLMVAGSVWLVLRSSGGQDGRQYLGIQVESWVISILAVTGAVLLAGAFRS